jgi:TIR domain
MASHVFISHASTDRPVAIAICDRLEAAGQKAWMAPRDLGAGELWGEAIVEAIDACNAMLVVLSPSATRSRQVLREVAQAADRGVALVPIRIEELRPAGALAYYLDAHHWLDAFPGPLEPHLSRIVTAVAALTGQAVVEQPAVPLPPDDFVQVVPDDWTVEPGRRRGRRLRSLFQDK